VSGGSLSTRRFTVSDKARPFAAILGRGKSSTAQNYIAARIRNGRNKDRACGAQLELAPNDNSVATDSITFPATCKRRHVRLKGTERATSDRCWAIGD
jgi:hypothetical protein